MDINKLKLGLTYIITDNKKISSKAKLQLINFIEQANTTQFKILVMDGEIISKNLLDEMTVEIINDRFSTMSHSTLNKAAFKAITKIVPVKK